jgi:hypothetical protein
MSSTSQRLLLLLCLACAATPPGLSAACAPPGTTCEEVGKADLIFIAAVLEATEVPRTDAQGRPIPDGITNCRFNVLEGLKGIEAGEFRAQFYFGGGLDLNSFRPGSRYLIFATRTTTGIYRSGCSPTNEITKTGEREWLPKRRTELGLCLKQR